MIRNSIPRYEPRLAQRGFGISHEAILEHRAQKDPAESHSSIDPGGHGPVGDVVYSEASEIHYTKQ